MADSFSVIILAGGFGRRLGRDKATVAVSGQPLLHWSALAAREVTDDIVVARRPEQRFESLADVHWREVVDHRHDRGPLAGLEAALPHVRYPIAVAVACDMPLLKPSVLRHVAAACAGVEIAMPLVNGIGQPLLAAYRRSIAGQATALLDQGDGRIRALLPLVSHYMVGEDELRQHDPDLESFTNINHEEDLLAVERVLERRRVGVESVTGGAPTNRPPPISGN